MVCKIGRNRQTLLLFFPQGQSSWGSQYREYEGDCSKYIVGTTQLEAKQ
jgi:hypothetical protein